VITELTPEWREFLLTGTRTGKLAIVRANGIPHVTPIWFLLDDNDDLVFTLCVDDQTPPFSYIMLECRIRSIDERDPGLREWAARIGGRYMGADRAESYGERNSIPGEYLVRAQITKIVAQKDIAG
jgi:hypothetical protein